MKKFILFTLLLFLYLHHFSFTQTIARAPYYSMTDWDTSPYKSFKLTGGANPNYNMTFRLLWPKGYDSSSVSKEKFPLVIMLHGGGESALGNDRFGTYPMGDPRRMNNDHHLKHLGREFLSAVNKGTWPGFVLFPQNPYGDWLNADWLMQNVVIMVEQLSKSLKIDPNRIFITGLSAGGKGVWAGLARYPHMFAAGMSFSGIDNPNPENTTKVANKRIWYFQGEIDTNPPKSRGDATIKALIQAGGNPLYTVYPETGHNTWNQAIREPDFFPFMLGYSQLSIHVYYGKTTYEEGETVNTRLAVSSGFNAYQWMKDGEIISGANSHEINATSLGSYQVRVRRGDVWTEWSNPVVIRLNHSPVIVSQPKSLIRSAGQSATFSVTVSDGTYTYQWQKNDKNIAGATGRSYTIQTVQPTDAGDYRVIVSSGNRNIPSNVAKLTVNSNLYALITSPSSGSKYKAGESVDFAGSGTDLYGDELEASAFKWDLYFHNNGDSTLVLSKTETKTGSFAVPTTGESSSEEFYRIRLTVSDKDGNKRQTQRDVSPRLSNITLDTEPGGFKIKVNSTLVTTPYSFDAVEGKSVNMEVQSPQVVNNISYNFTGWNDGGSSPKTFSVPENDITYTAIFVPVNKEPVAYINAPSEGTMYRGGQTISYEANGTDASGKPLSESAFKWELKYISPESTSILWTKTNTKTSSFEIPITGPASSEEYYQLILTITDPNGTQKTFTRDLRPNTSKITLLSEPSGLVINVDDKQVKTPYSFTGVEGKSLSFVPVNPQNLQGTLYKFSSWSQGGNSEQTIVVPENDVEYKAQYFPESNFNVAAKINFPEEGTMYKGGETISFSGSATDAVGSPAPGVNFSWELKYYFPNKPAAPVWTESNTDAGTFTIPASGASSIDEFYELKLTATYSDGSKRSSSRILKPQTSTITLNSEPVGLRLTLDGTTVVTPYSFETVVGKTKNLGVLTPQKFEGKTYNFFNWSQGGDPKQAISIPESETNFTAVFVSEFSDPVVTIVTPAEGTQYRGNETIDFSGNSLDSKGEISEATTFEWEIEFHHPDGVSSVHKSSDSKSGSFTIPEKGKTSAEEFYRIKLTVLDRNGSTTTVTRDIFPFTTIVTLLAEPAGLKVTLDSVAVATPYTFEAVQGKIRTIAAVTPQPYKGYTHTFQKWKNDGPTVQSFTVTHEEMSFTAIYDHDPSKPPTGTEKELFVKNSFVLFPVPARNHLTVSTVTHKGQKVEITVINSIGLLLKTYSVVGDTEGVSTFELNTTDLNNNSYILKVKKGNKEYYKQFIINK